GIARQLTRSPTGGRRCPSACAVGGWLNKASCGSDGWLTRCSGAGSEAGWLIWLLEIQVNGGLGGRLPTGRPRLTVRRLSPSVGGYRVRCEPAMAAVCTFGVHESSNVAVSLGAPGGGRERGRSCMGRGGVLDGCVMAFRR